MKLISINSGFFKLDGGAMFGVVPKRMWQKLSTPDENNLCTWAMRCLLIDTGERKILVDTGIGTKQDPKFRAHFIPWGQDVFLQDLAAKGYHAEDITDVLLTHLHFDHVGGAIQFDAKGNPEPTFPKARYWSNPLHFAWAERPNAREAASFLKENFMPLRDWGMLEMIDPSDKDVEWLPGIRLRFVNGHTEAMMLPIIDTSEGTVVYCADLIPSAWHIRMPYIMAYDVRPLETLKEKNLLLEEAVDGNYTWLFEHDPVRQSGRVVRDQNGAVTLDI